MRDRLDQRYPPPDLTWILKPGKSWRVTAFANVSVPTDRAGQGSGKKETLQALLEASPVWIQTLGAPWPADLCVSDKYEVGLHRELERRWKDNGLLWYGILRSEPMLLDLKKAKYSAMPRKKA